MDRDTRENNAREMKKYTKTQNRKLRECSFSFIKFWYKIVLGLGQKTNKSYLGPFPNN